MGIALSSRSMQGNNLLMSLLYLLCRTVILNSDYLENFASLALLVEKIDCMPSLRRAYWIFHRGSKRNLQLLWLGLRKCMTLAFLQQNFLAGMILSNVIILHFLWLKLTSSYSKIIKMNSNNELFKLCKWTLSSWQ